MESYEYQFNVKKPELVNDISKPIDDILDKEKVNNTVTRTATSTANYRFYVLLMLVLISAIVFNFVYSNNNRIRHRVINTIFKKNYIKDDKEWKEYTIFRNYDIDHMFYDEPKEKHNLNIVFINVDLSTSVSYLIKNTMLKMNGKCMITVVSNKDDYDDITIICNSLSENIQVLEFDDCNIYNKDFIKKLNGSNILLHDMNTLLLSCNFEKYLKYDYVGVDGFNLFKKNSILNLLNKVKIDNYESFIKELEINKMNLPSKDISESFTIDNIWNDKFIGCHKFWDNGEYIFDLN